MSTDVAAPEAERDLVRRAALGDHGAFADLVDLVGPGLYRYALRMLHDPTEAEDCVQEALTRAWLALDTYRGDARVRTWLFGIQANVVRHHLRRRPPEHAPVTAALEHVAPAGPGVLGPEQYALAADLREALDRALATLPARQREAWLLVTVEGLTYAEAALASGTTEASLRGCLERARRTLEGRLAPWR